MRKVLVSLMVLSLVPALATAVVTNPEGFEGYALTDDWAPTLAGEGWQFVQIHGMSGAVAKIVSDGGGQVLETDNSAGNWMGLSGFPMWDADGPADADFAVTKTSFDIKPLTGVLGSEFAMRFNRHPDTAEEPWQGTWEVGIRVGHYVEAGSPFGPTDPESPGGWSSLGTNVYLRTHQQLDQFIDTPIPGFGLGVWIVPGVVGTPPEIISEWWTMEVEEDNATQQTRARMYLRGETPSTWTPWQDHNGDITYAGTEGQFSGFMAGQIQMDNWSIIGEGPPPPAFLPGDANNDGLVSADDYASVQGHFGDTGAVSIPGDANGDGLVSADDYASVQSHFGDTAGVGGVSVPEPATMLLMAAGSLMLVKRKRKA